jgi:hypothetical protein
MVNPVLTILFDLFIIGSALAISSAMLGEYFSSRQPQIGSSRKYQVRTPQPGKRRGSLRQPPASHRRAA